MRKSHVAQRLVGLRRQSQGVNKRVSRLNVLAGLLEREAKVEMNRRESWCQLLGHPQGLECLSLPLATVIHHRQISIHRREPRCNDERLSVRRDCLGDSAEVNQDTCTIGPGLVALHGTAREATVVAAESLLRAFELLKRHSEVESGRFVPWAQP
eukprot:scaffold10110_cov69-Phaeocystis_antarctica.AAC.5